MAEHMDENIVKIIQLYEQRGPEIIQVDNWRTSD